MPIRVTIPTTLLDLTNNLGTVAVKGRTVGECLSDLIRQFPEMKSSLFDESGELQYYFEVYINSVSPDQKELDTPVKSGDELLIIQMVGGG